MSDAPKDLYAIIVDHDDRKDLAGLGMQLAGRPFENTVIIAAIQRLLQEKRIQAAYLLSRLYLGAGVLHPVLRFAQAVGGLLFGDEENERQGIAALTADMDRGAPEKGDRFFNQVMAEPLFTQVGSAVVTGDYDRILRILEILKAGTPAFRRIFDFDVDHSLPPLEDLRQHVRAHSRLLTFTSPQRHAVIAMRERVFPQDPNSRLLEIGHRIRLAMNAYGWRTTFVPMQWIGQLLTDYQSIVGVCTQQRPDLLVLDDQLVEHPGNHPPRASLIAHLRQVVPEMKVAGLLLDPWSIPPELTVAMAETVDVVWAMSPSLPVWERPALVDKVLHAPLPHAVPWLAPSAPLPQRVAFDGTLMGYNWHRAFWWAATQRKGLPVDWHLTRNNDDGLSALDSYAAYMRRLTKAGCVMNLSMRPNLTRIFTGRVFEALVSGSLLVQESSPDVECYLNANEHYLDFTSFAELRAICRLLTERPEEAEAIRQAGYNFARDHYNDDKLISYLDNHLFYPRS